MIRRGPYRARDWVVVRAPLLPVEALASARTGAPAWLGGAGTAPAAQAARIALAMATGSGHLAEVLGDDGDPPMGVALATDATGNGPAPENPQPGTAPRSDAGRPDDPAPGRSGEAQPAAPTIQPEVARKTSRYLIRMASRPTPYATFAGVAMGRVGTATRMRLSPGRERRSARPDAAWLMGLVADLEARDAVRAQLKLRCHPLLRVQDGRILPLDALSVREGLVVPSIEASEFVIAALTAAREPIRGSDLVAGLAQHCGATRERSEALVRELVAADLLLSELRPPLTGPVAPAAHVAACLRALPDPPPEAAAFTAVLAEIDAWNTLAPGPARLAWNALDRQLGQLRAEPRTRLQVDLALGCDAPELGQDIADAAAEAAGLLLRLSPQPAGSPALRRYRASFEARYGRDRCVPLLEVLDPRTGLGQPSGGEMPPADRARLARRHATLLALAQQAAVAGLGSIELDDATIDRLSQPATELESLPVSLDLAVSVLAESEAAIARGAWTLLISNNVGARQGGRYLGRFASMLGAPALAALQDLGVAERQHAPWAVWAESVYPPTRLRSANVAIRPHARDHEIAIGVAPGGDAAAIPVEQLDLALSDGQLRLYWRGQEVRVRAGHMLTTRQAPALSRFIEELDLQDGAGLSGFDWGPAYGQIFLPRVTRGRLVLAPAQWRVGAETLGGREALAARTWPARLAEYRTAWNLPREVYLVEGDNRLLLDLDDAQQAEQLRDALASRGEGKDILLQEALPARQHAWAGGSDGHYFTEWIIPLVRPARPGAPPRSPQAGDPLPPLQAVRQTAGDLARLRPPGTDWLFVKLYGPAGQEGELVAGPVQDFCTASLAGGQCASWFFIRYSDPDPHLRLRLRGDPNHLLGGLLPEVCRWAGGLLAEGRISRFAIDTYERELERYGGPAGLAWCETWFALDSQAVARLIRLQHQHLDSAPDRLALLAVSIDEMLQALGLDDAQRLAWYRRVVVERHASGDAYRKLQKPLRAWFDPEQRDAQWPSWWSAWARERATTAADAARRLHALIARGGLEIGLERLLSSLVHMHCNRLLGTDTAAERTALGLMLRVHEGLRGGRG